MTKAQYGDAYDRYPLKDGDEFHFVKEGAALDLFCGSFTNSLIVNEVAKLGPYGMVHTDPPWNQAITNRFYRGSVLEPPDFTELMISLALLLRDVCPQGLIAIEMGSPVYDQFSYTMLWAGSHILAKREWTYGSRSKPTPYICSFWSFQDDDTAEAIDPPADGALHGSETTRYIAGLAAGRTMIDPCCGVGTFPFEALKHGARRAVGVELQPRKLANAVDHATEKRWHRL